MKNIHLLPTDKPSRLHEYDFLSPMGLSKEPLQWRLGRNIYITSDEEIKEGDWFYSLFQGEERILKYNKFVIPFPKDKKIILTTDQGLIADGVQPIPNEFLEWFVNNSSCEYVDIKDWYSNILSCCVSKEECYCNKKRIIIPKEEPKQGTPEEPNDFGEIVNKEFFNLMNLKEKPKQPFYCSDRLDLDDNEKCETQCVVCVNKPKQETLEEVVLNSDEHNDLKSEDGTYLSFHKQSELLLNGAKIGVKYQKVRSYSEEEVFFFIREALYDTDMRYDRISVEDWFEQFKKK